jgi:hypothetical protein
MNLASPISEIDTARRVNVDNFLYKPAHQVRPVKG